MNSEPKPFASLSSGLLARKGAARPAMRPQGFGQLGAGLEDLGWNDMGFEPPKPVVPIRDSEHDAFGEEVDGEAPRHATGLTPIDSPVHDQQAKLAGRLAADEPSVEDEDEDTLDETAELFDPEVDGEPQPMAVDTRAPKISEVIEEDDPAPVTAVPAEAPVAIVPPRRLPRSRAAPGSKAKAAFTLRLDPERHLRLRLACAIKGLSAQQLVTDALDRLLATIPELDGMAAKAKRKE